MPVRLGQLNIGRGYYPAAQAGKLVADVSPVTNMLEKLPEDMRQARQRNLLEEAGRIAADQGYGAAANMLNRAGLPGPAMKFGEHGRTIEQADLKTQRAAADWLVKVVGASGGDPNKIARIKEVGERNFGVPIDDDDIAGAQIQYKQSIGQAKAGTFKHDTYGRVYDSRTGEFAEGASTPMAKPGSISVTEKKEIFRAEDDLANLDASVETLNKALALNKKTFAGYGASARGAVGAKLPDVMVPDFVADRPAAEATQEWERIMDLESIKTMASTLKGVTTDFELTEFKKVLSDVSTPAPIRKRTIERMLKLSKLQRQILRDRVDGIRAQTYFGKQDTRNVVSDPLAEARDAIERGAPREVVIERLQQMGIDPAGL